MATLTEYTTSSFPSIFLRSTPKKNYCEMDFLELELRRYGWAITKNGKKLSIKIDIPTKHDYGILNQYIEIYGSKSQLSIIKKFQKEEHIKNLCIHFEFK